MIKFTFVRYKVNIDSAFWFIVSINWGYEYDFQIGVVIERYGILLDPWFNGTETKVGEFIFSKVSESFELFDNLYAYETIEWRSCTSFKKQPDSSENSFLKNLFKIYD